jgi:predicted AlkP superfamily phosphohydrolase/phosphomutase
MPAWVVDRLLEEERLPGLARLASTGARAEHVTPGYPSITAQGWATLFTGAYGNVTGATGNTVPVLPRSEHTLLESESGFQGWASRAEPIWLPMLRAGRRVLVLSASGFGAVKQYQEAMEVAGVPSEQLVSYNAIGNFIAGPAVLDAGVLRPAEGWRGLTTDGAEAREFSLTLGESTFHALVFHDPAKPATGLNAVTVCAERKDLDDPSRCDQLTPAEATTDLGGWSRAFEAQEGDLVGRAYFRLFELAPDGSRMAFYRRSVTGLANPSPEQETFLDTVGALGDDPSYTSYLRGQLGATIAAGGDGTAERRFVETARLTTDLSKRAIQHGLERYEPDVLFHYIALSDQAGHSWIGVLDPRSPKFDPDLADRIWPYYVEILRLQDEVLGELLEGLDPSTIVTVMSDHGMAGAGKRFSANRVLEEAGLLRRHSDGRVNLEETSILGAWGGGYFLIVNSTDWKDGVVEQEQVDDVVNRATRALLSAVDPETGDRIVTRVFRPGEVVGLGMGGPTGGDLYLDLAYGYYPAEPGTSVARLLASRMGMGGHGYYPLRAEMQTVWFLAGGGILPGQVMAPVRQIDIAPTLSALAGVDIPADAEGHVIGELKRSR